MRSGFLKSVLVGSVCALALGGAAVAQTKTFSVPAGDLKAGLDAYIRQSGSQLIYRTDDVRGKITRGVAGALPTADALDRLLAGSGLVATRDAGGAVMVAKIPQAAAGAPPAGEAAQVGEVVVTGSRIRGAPPVSPVIALSQAEMRNAGQNDLGEVVRSIPQNFAGGQNPTVAIGATGANNNVTSGASLNLRGIGPDATLTLLNGHRLAHDGARQAVDISAIPLAAVDRIEIVTDGASALYGSDAVGGVANVVLKRDFEGLNARLRVGGSTEGGNSQRQVSIVGGSTWTGGGGLVAVDFNRSTAVQAKDRSYAQAAPDELTLIPRLTYRGVVASAHQTLAEGLEVAMDALYSRRTSESLSPLVLGGVLVNGTRTTPELTSFAIAPRLTLDHPGGWRSSLLFTQGGDKADVYSESYVNNQVSVRFPGYYDNTFWGAEATTEGPAFDLPAGAVRVALGAGYRRAQLDGLRASISGGVSTPSLRLDRSRENYYAFGELFLPLIDPAQGAPGVRQLSANLSARYENYPGVDEVMTPKIGVIYGLNSEFTVKASWGKSFKAPTLLQSYQEQTTRLLLAAQFGGTGLPANSTILVLSGGNEALQPEHATTWTATATFSPRAISGLHLEASYFAINFRDRAVSPIERLATSLSNPIYSDLVDRAPTAAKIAASIAGAATGLTNGTSLPFNPATVVAIVDNRALNAARQSIRGFDVSARYLIDLDDLGQLALSASGSYLRSSQRLSARQPSVDLAGTVFNQPHWRLRAGATWDMAPTTVSLFASYSDDVLDTRFSPSPKVKGMATLDATAIHRLSGARLLGDLELSVSVLNLFNAKPDTIRTSVFYLPPYDSTNYSSVGRFISVTVAKQW